MKLLSMGRHAVWVLDSCNGVLNNLPDDVLQERALLTYVRRVYYPFLLRDPELSAVDGMLCAYWVHTHPTVSGMPQAQSSLSVACLIPALDALPAALKQLEDDVIKGSGESSDV
jgi:acetyl-CoA carboxylase/biotin carboxylase 1